MNKKDHALELIRRKALEIDQYCTELSMAQELATEIVTLSYVEDDEETILAENAALHMELQSALIKIADLERQNAELSAKLERKNKLIDTIVEATKTETFRNVGEKVEKLLENESQPQAEQVTLSMPLPKFKIGDKVRGGYFKNGTIVEIRQRNDENEYCLEYDEIWQEKLWWAEKQIHALESEAK